MRKQLRWQHRGAQLAAVLIGLAALAFASLPAQAAPFNGRRSQFADAGFNTVWQRTDAQSVRGGRSWYWGPQPWFDYAEFYRQGPHGLAPFNILTKRAWRSTTLMIAACSRA